MKTETKQAVSEGANKKSKDLRKGRFLAKETACRRCWRGTEWKEVRGPLPLQWASPKGVSCLLCSLVVRT